MAAAKSSGNEHRVIVHLDLDCFYAQVEQQRLNIPREEPLAVQQWGSLLAINYVARKLGVDRGDNVTEAKKKCPHLHVPHVELLGENRKPGSAYDRTHQKAILRRYRVASKKIYEILGRFASVCERAGIDEAYLDITEQVRLRLEKQEVVSSDFCGDPGNADTKVVGITALEGAGKEMELEPFDAFPLTEEERWLSVGASVTREIRKAIFDELGYTCSVGIATNKLVAKMISPLNKPDGQAIVSPRFFARLMQHFPLRKIRGLGGKLGRDLMGLYYKHKGQEVNVLATNSWGQVADPSQVGVKPTLTVAAFMEMVSMDDLVAHLGRETATYVRGFCNGDDGNDPVNANKTEIKSFMAAKQYDEKSRLQDINQLKYWVPILAVEVLERCEEEKSENKRFPSQVCINFTRVGAKTKPRHFAIALDATLDSIVKAALAALQHDFESMFPCSSLSIHIKDFMAMGSRSASISTFFSRPAVPVAEDGSGDPEVAATAAAAAAQREEEERFAFTPAPTASQVGGKRKISSFFTTAAASASSSSSCVAPDEPEAEATASRSASGSDGSWQEQERILGSTAETDTQSSSSSDPFFCDRCDKFVYDSKTEHTDFHFAMALSKSSSGGGGGFSLSSSSSSLSSSQLHGKAKKLKSQGGPMDAFLGR